MNIDGPFYLKEIIYNNPILRKFTSNENVLMIIDIIFNYVKHKTNTIHLNNDDATLVKMRDIISYFGETLLSDISVNNNIESITLVNLNKDILKHIILFLTRHKGNLDVFEIYASNLMNKKRINEHIQIEEQLKEQDKGKDTNANKTPLTFVKNEFISSDATNTTNNNNNNNNHHLISLQEQINHLSKKYSTDLVNNIVIEKVSNPDEKYVITRLEELDKEDTDKLNMCVEYLKTSILDNSNVNDIYKKNTQDIIQMLMNSGKE